MYTGLHVCTGIYNIYTGPIYVYMCSCTRLDLNLRIDKSYCNIICSLLGLSISRELYTDLNVCIGMYNVYTWGLYYCTYVCTEISVHTLLERPVCTLRPRLCGFSLAMNHPHAGLVILWINRTLLSRPSVPNTQPHQTVDSKNTTGIVHMSPDLSTEW